MFEVRVLRTDVTKAVTFLNNRLHAQPESKPESKSDRPKPWGGLRSIRPAEIKVLMFLNHKKWMDHRGQETQPATPASVALAIKFPKGIVQAALKVLVKNEYAVPVTAGYYATERGFRANLNLSRLLIQE
jgi:hypothetical protein